jgi:hypothetical protein
MNRIDCREFDERFHEALDNRDAPERDQVLIAHARQCSSCAGVLRAQQAISAVICRADLKYAASPVVRRRSGYRRFAASMIAACVPVFLIAGWMLRPASDQVNNRSSGSTVNDLSLVSDSNPPADGDLDLAVAWRQWISIQDPPSTSWLVPVVQPIQPLKNSVTSTWNVLIRTITPVKRAKKTVDDSMGGRSDNADDHSIG